MSQLLDLIGSVPNLPDEPRIVASGNFAAPLPILAEIDRGLDRWRLCMLNAQKGIPDREGMVLETSFVGPGMRKSPRLRYVPSRLSMVPRLFHTAMKPDVVVLHTSTPHKGLVSLGTEVNILPAAVEAVRERGGVLVAQVNPQMPFTYGDALVPEAAFDLMIEVDEPLAAHTAPPLDDDSVLIGAAVAARVPDGATLQAGIGAVPDAALRSLTDRRQLKVWTEMFSDSILELEKAGALSTSVPLHTSFVFGSTELYEWLDQNARVRMLRSEVSNDPIRIANQQKMTSVNTALQVDLFGQANASRINARIFSGFGGQTDFIVGAMHCDGGQALMGLRSWHPKADVSTIVALVDEPVTSFQQTAVITENGTAELFGHDQQKQARHLIEFAAHPDVRDELWEDARSLGLA